MKHKVPHGLATLAASKRLIHLGENWPLLYGLIIVAIYIVTILTAVHPPFLQDYPTWVYEGVAVSHRIAGHADLQFGLKHYPVPNALSDVALGLLVNIMTWQWAAKVWACLYLVFAYGACLRFLNSAETSNHVANVIMPNIVIVNLCFWYGFVNFQLALAMLVLFCSFLLRGTVKLRVISPFLALIFLTHAVPFVVSSLALLAYIKLNRAYRLLLAYVPSVLLGGWYLYGRFGITGSLEGDVSHEIPPIAYMSKAFLAYKVNTYFKSLGYINPEIGGKTVLPSLIGLAGLTCVFMGAIVLGVLFLRVMIASGRMTLQDKSPARMLWLVIGIVTVVASICPFEALGIFDPGARFLVCALTLGVLLINVRGPAGRVIMATSVMLGVTNAYMFVAISSSVVSKAVIVEVVPNALTHFAHVSPMARSGFYDALTRHDMSYRSFDTALLYNAITK